MLQAIFIAVASVVRSNFRWDLRTFIKSTFFGSTFVCSKIVSFVPSSFFFCLPMHIIARILQLGTRLFSRKQLCPQDSLDSLNWAYLGS